MAEILQNGRGGTGAATDQKFLKSKFT